MKIKLDEISSLITQIIVATFLGCVVALVANIFVSGLRFFEEMRANPSHLFFSISEFVPALLLVFAFFLIKILRKFEKTAGWEGPADIILCAQNSSHTLSPKRGIFSILASFISLSGGASLGQYGPIVHLGGFVGMMVSKFFLGTKLSREIILGCGVAAAISAGFNAPVAGVIFAHEAILRHFSSRGVALLSISSICASSLGYLIFEIPSLFSIEQNVAAELTLVPVSILGGVLFGLGSIVMMKTNFWLQGIAGKSMLNTRLVTYVGISYLIVLSFFVPEVIGLGMSTVSDLFITVGSADFLIILLIAKLTAIIVSANIGFAGGFFGPALFIGAVLGSLMAVAAHLMGVMISSTVLAVSGAAAVAGTVIGAPIAMIILVLELTHSYEMTVAALLSIVVSSLICHIFYGHSLFDLQIIRRGIDLAKGKTFLEMEAIRVGSLLSEDFLSFEKKQRASEILKEMQKAKQSEAYLVDNKRRLLGKIMILDVVSKSESTAETLARLDFIKLEKEQSLNKAMSIAAGFVGESIPVIDNSNGTLLGVVNESQLFYAYLKMNDSVRDIENA